MSKTKKPGKQRKRRFKAPLHKKEKFLSSLLSKELREEFEKRNLVVRRGDEVKVMRGDFSGIKGKVRNVDHSSGKVEVEDVTREKTDGTEVHVPLTSSNLMIVDPDLSDRKRQKIIQRAGGKVKKERIEKKVKKEEKKKEIEEKTGFKCPVCGEIFDTKKGLNIHKGKTHKEYLKG